MIICERGHDEKIKKWGKLSEKRKKKETSPQIKIWQKIRRFFREDKVVAMVNFPADAISILER